jgi:hypothetical protein
MLTTPVFVAPGRRLSDDFSDTVYLQRCEVVPSSCLEAALDVTLSFRSDLTRLATLSS